MSKPSAPPMYPDLPINDRDDGQTYRLQRIREIETEFRRDIETRKSLYKKYKRILNTTDGVDVTLISGGVVMSSVGFAVPMLFPIQIAAITIGGIGLGLKVVRRYLQKKIKKHDSIKHIAQSKLNSVQDLVSRALQDGHISEDEFKTISQELDKYRNMKRDLKRAPDKPPTLQNANDEEFKKQLEDIRKLISK